jgi:hypothetical protein
VITLQARTREAPKPTITCPECGGVSEVDRDIETGWCPFCVKYTGAVPSLTSQFDLNRGGYFDRQTHRITFARWVWLTEHGGMDYKRVAEDTIGDVWVSTVWIGIDMSFTGERPLIFETMTFGKDGEVVDFEGIEQWRYTTEAAANVGHEAICAEARVLRDGF